METFRPWAVFHADFPDDHIEDDDGITHFGGKAVTEAIAGMLAAPGRTLSTPQHEHEHGWTFDVRANGARVWFQISDMGDDGFLLISKGYWRNHRALHLEVLNFINATLSQDARFTAPKWYEQEEFSTNFAGAESPLGPEFYIFEETPPPRLPASAFSSEEPPPPRYPVSVFSLKHVLLMARIRPWAHFKVDFPDEFLDRLWGPINLGKRGAVSAMYEALEATEYWGIDIFKGRGKGALHLYQRGFYKRGRRIEFHFKFNGSAGRVFCKKPSLIGRYWHLNDELYIAAVADLDAELRRDPRFSNIRWQFHGLPWLKTSGADSPFSETPELKQKQAA